MPNFTRRSLMSIIVLLMSLIIAQTAWAKKPINSNWRGISVKGYDVVAYFTLGEPTKGDKTFSYKWKDAEWYFANTEHLELFKADPEKYAPQYGGY